jgi:hypothetical protein
VSSGVEQHTHGDTHGDEMIPFLGLSFVAVLHPEQAMTLVGRGDTPDESLRFKADLPSGRYLLAVAAAVGAFVVVPYVTELARCWKASRAHKDIGMSSTNRAKRLSGAVGGRMWTARSKRRRSSPPAAHEGSSRRSSLSTSLETEAQSRRSRREWRQPGPPPSRR